MWSKKRERENWSNKWSNSFELDSHWKRNKNKRIRYALLEMALIVNVPVVEQDMKMSIQYSINVVVGRLNVSLRPRSSPVSLFRVNVLVDWANVRCILHIRLSASCYGTPTLKDRFCFFYSYIWKKTNKAMQT